MKVLFQKIKTFLGSQNPAQLIIRLVAVAALCSHIIGYHLWFTSDAILSLVPAPYFVHPILFVIISILCVIVVAKPKYVSTLIIVMIISAFLNIHIVTPFWINYVLLLLFARFDTSLQLAVWLSGIQEIWAGLNKFNSGYLDIINFFTEPFSKIPVLVVIVGLGVLLVPILEILIGLGILFRKRFAPYLTTIVHGGAIVLLSFVHYGEIVWAWNILIIAIVWTLYNNNVSVSIRPKKDHTLVIIILMIIPLFQVITTLAYPFSYRMYTGSESLLLTDGKSYAVSYYQKTKSLPFQSKEVFETILKQKCLDNEFTTAEIIVPSFLSRKQHIERYSCSDSNLTLQ